MRFSPGLRLGPYEYRRRHRRRREVYRARDTKLGRKVALKVQPEAIATDSDRLTRFEPEARTLAGAPLSTHLCDLFVRGAKVRAVRWIGSGTGNRTPI